MPLPTEPWHEPGLRRAVAEWIRQQELGSIQRAIHELAAAVESWNFDLDALDRWENEGGGAWSVSLPLAQ